MFFRRNEFNPYQWRVLRDKGRGLYVFDNGLIPGVTAGVAYAALMMMFGSTSSAYLNAAMFTLVATPIYAFFSYRSWDSNEDAFAAWVAKRGRELAARQGIKSGPKG